MSSDIVLTAALRNNLLSLQNTQRLIDTTQLRLATGLKVNSALDNASSFFTAQTLSNRAGDLSRLLDNINLSIRTIEEANAGVEALSTLVSQADAIVSSARDELAASDGSARIVSSLDLSGVAALTTLGDGATVLGTETFNFTTTDDSGNRISRTIALGAGTINAFAATITDTFADLENGEITASINDSGNLVIESVGGRTFSISASDAAGTGDIDTQLGLLGLDTQFALQDRTIGTAAGAFQTVNIQATTVVAGNTVSTISLYESPGNLIEAGDLINTGALGGLAYEDANGNTALDGVSGLGFAVDINGTTTTIAANGGTFQSFVDSINNNTTINEDVSAEFDSLTGQVRITALSDDVRNITVTAVTLADGFANIGLGDPTGNLDPISNGLEVDRAGNTVALDIGAGNQDFVVSFNSSTAALDALAGDYNSVRVQIDQLVEDASFRGINLLNGDNLTTFFNENNTNSLIT